MKSLIYWTSNDFHSLWFCLFFSFICLWQGWRIQSISTPLKWQGVEGVCQGGDKYQLWHLIGRDWNPDQRILLCPPFNNCCFRQGSKVVVPWSVMHYSHNSLKVGVLDLCSTRKIERFPSDKLGQAVLKALLLCYLNKIVANKY